MKSKYLSLVSLIALVVLGLTACGNNNNNNDKPNEQALLTAKTWNIKAVIDQTNGNADVTSSFSGKKAQFNSDGTYSHDLGSATETGSYALGGSTITFTPSSDIPYAASLTEVSITSTQLTFKVTVTNVKTGDLTYAITME